MSLARSGLSWRGLVALLALTWTTACPGGGGSDGDADSDSDGDSDDEGPACPADWECCDDSDCSNGVFCDGLEMCDRGLCQGGPLVDCDDGRDCTEDVCDEMANLCVHEPVHDRCLDEDLCNGEERCAPGLVEADERGCIPGRPLVCDDGDRCTDDYCEDNLCLVRLKDSDDDGYGDADCSLCDPDDPRDCVRGTDCDDADPEVFPGAAEVCDDGVDNNCDRLRDYADSWCDVPNDGCADAVPLSPGVLVHSSTRGTRGDIDSACAPAEDEDVAFGFTISEVQDVEVTVESLGGRPLTVGLTGDCGSPDADIKCTTGRTFTLVSRALAPGTYYVVVSSPGEVDFDILFAHHDPVPRPDADTCPTAVDISGGGTFAGTTRGFDPDYESVCGEDADRDVTFVFTLSETSAVDLSVDASEPVAVAVQSTCGVLATEEGCFEGDPAEGRVGSLAPGVYYVIVKSATEVDFTLDLAFSPTSADGCAHLREVGGGGTFFGTTHGLTADVDSACGDPLGPDAVYALTLAETRDVTVDFTSFGEATTLSLTSACDDPGAELRCSTGEAFQLRGRGLEAGSYYLVATGTRGADFEIEVTTSSPVPTPPDDLCTGAVAIPGSGSYAGDTFDCENDYDSRCGDATDLDSTFVFTLTDAQSLDMTVTGGSGPVAVAIQPDCGVVGTERACFEAAPSGRRYFRNLDPGTYYLVFKTPTADTFSFDLAFGPADPTTMVPWIDSSTHTVVALATPFSDDDNQYNVDIAPLAFPFNGTTYGCLAVSTNGYVRFGPSGACPSATGYSDEHTDIEFAYAGSPWGDPPSAQVSWLGADGYAGSRVSALVDTAENRVVVTYLDHRYLGSSLLNDVQLVFFCDTGDIQISYQDCSFDGGGWAPWSIGVSEPAVAGGSLQPHDFPGQTPGTVVTFGPGAIDQTPEHPTAAAYLPLNGRGIYFTRSGSGWEVLVDDLPL